MNTPEAELNLRIVKLREKNDSLRAENHSLRETVKKFDALTLQCQAFKTTNCRLERALETARSDIAALRKVSAELSAELERERNQRMLRVDADCDLRLGRELFMRRKNEEREGKVKPVAVDADSVLGMAMQGAYPAVLLLDAHNILFGMPSRYNPSAGHAMKESEKRNALIKDVRRFVEDVPSVRAWLVFDGSDTNANCEIMNLRVMYSGGIGMHRADRVLIDAVRYFKSSDPQLAVLLVSDDRDLRKRARKAGAEVMAVLEFGPYLPSTRG